MNKIVNELDNLLLRVNASKSILKFSDNITLEELKTICDSSPQMVGIMEMGKFHYSVVACNNSSCKFLGITEAEINKLGFKYVLRIIHPDNMNSVYRVVSFFNNPENIHQMFSTTWYLKSNNGWEWCYSCMKPAIFNPDGTVKYIVSVGCSINHLLKTRKQFKLFRKDLDFFEDNLEKYLSMTEREKEILKLITEEFTSNDIAKKLSISPFTVDTHRKNLIEKLDVKSSVGLAKFSLLFNLK